MYLRVLNLGVCVSVSASTILFISNGECCGGFAFCDKIINNVYQYQKHPVMHLPKYL